MRALIIALTAFGALAGPSAYAFNPQPDPPRAIRAIHPTLRIAAYPPGPCRTFCTRLRHRHHPAHYAPAHGGPRL